MLPLPDVRETSLCKDKAVRCAVSRLKFQSVCSVICIKKSHQIECAAESPAVKCEGAV